MTERLSRLGVTRVCLLGDDEVVVVVLEGWAFEPARDSREVQVAMFGPQKRARVLGDLATLTIARVP